MKLLRVKVRPCAVCGVAMKRRTSESGSQYAKRKYCSHVCSVAALHKLRGIAGAA